MTDRSFHMRLLQPPSSYFLKAAAGIDKGAARTKHETVGTVTMKQLYEIAVIKSKAGRRLHG